jgi:hypothetical protein
MRSLLNERKQNVARKPRRAVDIFQQRGRVARVEGAVIAVDTGEGTYEAKRALSCLVEPIQGDVVLVAIGDDGVSHVLAVLEREGREPAHVSVDRDMTVKLSKGRFTVAAQDGIDLATARDVTVASAGVSVTAAEGSFVLKRLAYLGSVVHAEVERVKHAGIVLDSVLERVSQRVKRSIRLVEEVDHVRAAEIDYSAKSNMHLRGHNAIVTAEELVKIDGEQIHLG